MITTNIIVTAALKVLGGKYRLNPNIIQVKNIMMII